MNVYKRFLRPLLFRFDAERTHELILSACALAGRVPFVRSGIAALFGTRTDARLRSEFAGISFPNPVGLGAGYDKNGKAVDVLARMGFGFMEVGSVSLWPSVGNPVRPRLYRLPADNALIGSPGVPNDGAPVVSRRLVGMHLPIPLGVNLVETNTGSISSPEAAIAEICEAVGPFLGHCNMLFLSTECANTDGAHPIANLDNLRKLLEGIGRYDRLPPIFIKIRVPFGQISKVLAAVHPFPFVRGFRINTVVPRPFLGLRTPSAELDRLPGGLTSPMLQFPRVLAAVRAWYALIDPSRFALIASGGIRSGDDAYQMIRAGASLVEIVTALIFEGPSLARRINTELSLLLERDGYANLAQAVGVDARATHSVETV